MTNPYRQNGFSLIELMVAMTLGLILIAAVGALFLANKRNYEQNSKIAEMQSNGRFAVQALSRDLAMAGFLGGLTEPNRLVVDSTALSAVDSGCGPGTNGDNGWMLDATTIEFLDNVSANTAPTIYGCLTSQDLAPGTDVIALHRTPGVPTARIKDGTDTATLREKTFYLRTNRTEGVAFFSDGSSSPPSNLPTAQPPVSFWEYQSRLYFVRNYADTPGDGIPSLCRKYLASGKNHLQTECVAEGVEDLQIAFGIDTDDDGVANRYRPNPTRAQLADAITARVQLLIRAIEPDHQYTNTKHYNLLGANDDGESYQPDDHFYRRVLQTTVGLKNAR